MSTLSNLLAAPVAAGSEASAQGKGLAGLVQGWRESLRQAMALRRSLREISMLSDRELADIGLAQDEILRLRSSEMFTPRNWRAPAIGRDELPF